MKAHPVAVFVKYTFSAYSSETKDRWECPECRMNKAPECRFNLSPKKRGKTHICRFCKKTLEIPYLCPACKLNGLIPCPVNSTPDSYYCHVCNKDFKKEEIENV